MNRLILFGCSHTYGHGLPDCVTATGDPGSVPSKLVWGEILGSRMGREVINCSFPGASNQKILQTILEFTFYPTDKVVIFWSFFTRRMLYQKEGTQDIGPWQTDDIALRYYELHGDQDLYTNSLLNIHHADCYLSSRHIDYIHFTLAPDTIDNVIAITGNEPSWFNVESNPIQFPKLYLDLAVGGHPGIKSQANICDYIEKVINNDKTS